jgi:hypothetical protein
MEVKKKEPEKEKIDFIFFYSASYQLCALKQFDHFY